MRQFRARSVQNRGVFQSKTHSFSFFFQISIDFLKFLIFAFHLLDKKKNVFKFQTYIIRRNIEIFLYNSWHRFVFSFCRKDAFDQPFLVSVDLRHAQIAELLGDPFPVAVQRDYDDGNVRDALRDHRSSPYAAKDYHQR